MGKHRAVDLLWLHPRALRTLDGPHLMFKLGRSAWTPVPTRFYLNSNRGIAIMIRQEIAQFDRDAAFRVLGLQHQQTHQQTQSEQQVQR